MEKKLLLALGIGGYALLLLITCLHHQPPLFDEPLFIPNVHLFEQYGLSREFLVKIDNQAPGPLYQFIHYPLQPLTHLQTPGIRLVNTVLLGGMIILLTYNLSRYRRIPLRDAWLPALAIMAVPMVWQVAGMALTEIPPMFFASLSIWWLLLALQCSDWKSFPFAILAGVALGFAILGRSPFLMMAPASALLLLYHVKDGRRWMLILIYTGCALAMCVPVFIIWKGLMPPQQAVISAGGIKPWHGILAFAYGALLTIIIAPQWFVYNRRILFALIAAYIILLIANISVLHYEYAPLSEALGKVMPVKLMQVYPYVISPLLATVALYFLCCSAWQAWLHRTDNVFLFLLAAGILVLATSFKVTHLFSSRYVAQAAPFFVLVLAGYDRISYNRCLRFAVGMCIGLLSLETYFLFR
ncbi:glycosyltransferase family 39 protein [Chitinophaga vietnamensis]|uniref:glycosyltransferase family 39 protein n=1 Tax=Chitinophaga vietnamensis TaxID=2593957 RepID=UPI0013762FB2|nr:glycosyltransferase family 39 protein [Chitinophaga vietnamensis]